MEIFPGVHWLDLGYSNAYLLEGFAEGEKGLALIDSGPPGRSEKILAYVRELGRDSEDISHILITHADWDHAGSAAAVQRASGARVVGSAATLAFLTEGRSPKHLPRLIQFIADRFLHYDALPDESVQILEAGETLPFLQGLELVPTPGHTPDHHSFYSPASGVLFAGDALSTRGDTLNSSPPRITADRDEAQRSARHLLSLAPVLIACGHGTPMQGHSNADVMALLQQLK